jgi:hypothetical protein
VPEGAAASGEGLEGPKTVNMGNGNTQYFKATNLPANKLVKLSIDVGSVKKVKQSAAVAPNPFDAATAAKAIGGVGAILVVLLGAAFMLMKSPRQVQAQKSHS